MKMQIPMLTIECQQANGSWAVVARVAPWQHAESAIANWRRWYPKSKFRFTPN
jgi:hypothetical protein